MPCHVSWHSSPVHCLLIQQLPNCKPLGLWAWGLSLPWVLGQKCQEVTTWRISLIHLLRGEFTSLLSSDISEACPLQPPRSSQGAWDGLTAYSSNLPLNTPCIDFLPWPVSLVHVPTQLLALKPLSWVLILGNSNSVQTVLVQINIQTFEVLRT